MKRSRSQQLLEKSIKAMVCAIEIYNKPDFEYREETFAILALNAWELLLKAKLLVEGRNNLAVIYLYEHRQNKDGSISKKSYIKRNRAGNPQTVSLGRSIALIQETTGRSLSRAIIANLDGLIEVRDNAVHFMNVGPDLAKKIQELGSACIQNYMHLMTEWFSTDMSRYNFFLMPLSFFRDFGTASTVFLNRGERNLFHFLNNLDEGDATDESSVFNVTLKIDLRLHGSRTINAMPVRVTKDSSAITVILSEEEFRERYPWPYGELINRLKDRYTDFTANQQFFALKKTISENPSLVQKRYLHPGNPRSQSKDWYSPNILQEFDKHYTKK